MLQAEKENDVEFFNKNNLLKSKHNSNKVYNKKLLIIDDDISQILILKSVFKNKYKIETTNCADHGIEILKSKKIDCVLIDYYMPHKNGISASREIRKFNTNIPILMLTGYANSITVDEALKAGVNKILKKPVEIKELMESVSSYVNKK